MFLCASITVCLSVHNRRELVCGCLMPSVVCGGFCLSTSTDCTFSRAWSAQYTGAPAAHASARLCQEAALLHLPVSELHILVDLLPLPPAGSKAGSGMARAHRGDNSCSPTGAHHCIPARWGRGCGVCKGAWPGRSCPGRLLQESLQWCFWQQAEHRGQSVCSW